MLYSAPILLFSGPSSVTLAPPHCSVSPQQSTCYGGTLAESQLPVSIQTQSCGSAPPPLYSDWLTDFDSSGNNGASVVSPSQKGDSWPLLPNECPHSKLFAVASPLSSHLCVSETQRARLGLAWPHPCSLLTGCV